MFDLGTLILLSIIGYGLYGLIHGLNRIGWIIVGLIIPSFYLHNGIPFVFGLFVIGFVVRIKQWRGNVKAKKISAAQHKEDLERHRLGLPRLIRQPQFLNYTPPVPAPQLRKGLGEQILQPWIGAIKRSATAVGLRQP
jgi:hypothetical protein